MSVNKTADTDVEMGLIEYDALTGVNIDDNLEARRNETFYSLSPPFQNLTTQGC